MSTPYGFIERMDFGDYAAIDAINYSSLKHMMRSPMQYRFQKDNPKPPTDEMVLGTATHRMILEPERVGDFAVWGELENQKVRRGKVWDDFLLAHDSEIIVTADQRDAMIGMAKQVRKGAAKRYLTGPGMNEVTMVWRDRACRRDFKGRPDRIMRMDARGKNDPGGKRHIIVDLKTTRDCQPFRFGQEFYRLGYHIQASMYRDGYFYLTGIVPEYVVIAIDQKPPHESVAYLIPDDLLQVGKDDQSRLLKQLFACEKRNAWPPAITEPVELQLPAYAYAEAVDGEDLGELELAMED